MKAEQIDEMILVLQERRCQLESARINTVANLNAIAGGIAEMDYLVQQLEVSKAAVCEPETEPATPEE